ncbi:exported protein [Bordetella bronchiseptica]|uniref:exported protein n=1 Tax=Bordetella bronchiseptica TaxID=518 RepID=UPI00028BA965|nr:exported protein [Bordetella bronchiseptica]KCV34971.1 hypothetical protein L489_3621 [Bordetella bronchiseptica 00-P-2730]KDD51246.1 hypothetical protein L533_3484 [Bordetella bronchiseptica OSU553]AUL15134.1 hypothetical protein BTL45_09675 [Bordetella bronchiseptica]AWP58233.1 hypothetical protein B7P02_09620 [Bordetella bronchiseptica]AWQ04966.1 hypothetical protein B9G73_09590 [Bordetella bronchiseptica]
MTTQSRIAAFLSTSALCLGLAAAPSAYAAQSDTQSGAKSSVKAPSGGKHAKSEKHAKSGAHHGAHHAKTGSTSTK